MVNFVVFNPLTGNFMVNFVVFNPLTGNFTVNFVCSTLSPATSW